MKKKIDKQELLKICIQKQEEQVANFSSRVASMKSDLDSNSNSASQTEDRTAGNAEILHNYEQELAFSATDLNYLKSINPDTEYSTVEPGALVVTKELRFLISISTEKFEIDGDTIVGISDRAPIYQGMQGLAKGDSFKFNETEYLIEEIY